MQYEKIDLHYNNFMTVNILLSYIAIKNNNLNFKNLIEKCDLLCFHHNMNYKDLVLLLKIDIDKSNKYIELINNKQTIFASFINKIINKLYKGKYDDIQYWYSYFNEKMSLEMSTCVYFDLSDEYYLYKQKIEFWEFDVRRCFSRISRLIIGNVNFTKFDSLYKQSCCIKSLRYSIKEIVWKNFISELLFNNSLKINKIKENTVSINFSEQISIIINGKFSRTDNLKGFLSLFGHGKLIPIDNVISKIRNLNISKYILEYITFSYKDILYFNSIFPARKVIGPDFHDLNIPESILDNSVRFNSDYVKNNDTSEFTRFIFHSKFGIKEIFKDIKENTLIQILSI